MGPLCMQADRWDALKQAFVVSGSLDSILSRAAAAIYSTP